MSPELDGGARAFAVCSSSWFDPDDRARLMAVRTTVFVVEQNVPSEIEIDDADEQCLHVLAVNADQEPIGTARLDELGHVGRVAVLKSWRRKGVGSALVKQLIQVAKQRGRNRLELNSQVTAIDFYQSLGFTIDPDTPEFQEAGIPHVKMVLKL